MEWYPSQVAFSNGEVSGRMLSRLDTEVYRQSCLDMRNFMPRMQGPATRSPGTSLLEPLGASGNSRIIPYHTIDNRRALFVLTPGAARLITNIEENQAGVTPGVQLPVQVVNNPDFNGAGPQPENNWQVDPEAYIGGQGYEGGCFYLRREYGTVLYMSCRDWKFPNQDKDFATVTQQFELPYDSVTIKFDYLFRYLNNAGAEGLAYTFTVKVGTTPGGSEIWSLDLSNQAIGVYQDVVTVNLPAYTAPINAYITIELTADEFASTPAWELDRFEAFIDGPVLPANPVITPGSGVEYYTAAELPDVQFIQSPYDEKPLVLVHPNHPPQEFLYDPGSGNYEFRLITFTSPPSAWQPGNYPSSCTAYQGRLMLAGTPDESETIWGSRPGLWYDFQLFINNPTGWPTGAADLYTPDSALEITTTYRSEIKWMYGQKDLLVGATDLEYALTSASGLLSPGDTDVRLEDTHGAINVQPASIGGRVAFAAERGRRVRLSRLDRDTDNWLSPDATMLADHIVSSGVRRMVRMRNPHQMLVCLLNSGDMAIYHYDETAGIQGWSRVSLPGNITDIAVSPVSDGVDVLYLLSTRTVEGVSTQFIEAVYNWVYEREWQFMASSVLKTYDVPTSTIDGLEHLNGSNVQVVADGTFYGTFPVENGELELVDDTGVPIEVTAARVGLATTCFIQLLPPVVDDIRTGGLSAFKRYVDIAVRVAASTRPIINGERPADRDPASNMDASATFEFLADVKVSNLGHDPFALITVEENVPFRVEILSITGKLTSDNL